MSVFETPKLARDDKNQSERTKQLADARTRFQFDYSTIDQLPISAFVPEEAIAGTQWKLKVVATTYKNRRNLEAILKDKPYLFEKPLPHKSPAEIAKILLASDLPAFLEYCHPDMGVVKNQSRPTTFEEYFDFFKKLDMPDSASTLFDDRDFTEYFVRGLNPLMIENIEVLDTRRFPVNDSHLQRVPGFENDTLQKALADRRLFIVDYKAIADLQPGQHPFGPKKVYAPILLFAVHPTTSELHIIAIQSGQDSAIYPIFVPDQSWSWTAAKLITKSADANYHEIISHLGLTHLLIDPIAVATYRQLPQLHPLHVLLAPHFEGTIPINALGVKRLLPANGSIGQLLAGTTDSAYDIMRQVRGDFDFKENYLPNSLAKRGVTNASTLKNYPYRDDALLVWDAIQTWTTDYINRYYKEESHVTEDAELQAWADEVTVAGRVKGFGTNGHITSKSELAEILTMIIFTASAQHAAVNFPQKDAALVSIQPLAGYADAPTRFDLTKDDLLNYLPPIDRAIKQVHTLTLLGSTYYTQLGQYSLGTFKDVFLVDDILRFQSKLRSVESTIKQRNKTRRKPYTHLLPSNIPNSINI